MSPPLTREQLVVDTEYYGVDDGVDLDFAVSKTDVTSKTGE